VTQRRAVDRATVIHAPYSERSTRDAATACFPHSTSRSQTGQWTCEKAWPRKFAAAARKEVPGRPWAGSDPEETLNHPLADKNRI